MNGPKWTAESCSQYSVYPREYLVCVGPSVGPGPIFLVIGPSLVPRPPAIITHVGSLILDFFVTYLF